VAYALGVALAASDHARGRMPPQQATGATHPQMRYDFPMVGLLAVPQLRTPNARLRA